MPRPPGKMFTSPFQSPAWMEDAACAGMDDYSMWFPEHSAYAGPAKKICAKCPVKMECRQYAIDNDITYGVWGGLSEADRKRMKKRLKFLRGQLDDGA